MIYIGIAIVIIVHFIQWMMIRKLKQQRNWLFEHLNCSNCKKHINPGRCYAIVDREIGYMVSFQIDTGAYCTGKVE